MNGITQWAVGAPARRTRPGDWLIAVIVSGLDLARSARVRRWLLAIVVLEIPIQIDVYLDHRVQAEALGAVPGLNLSVTTGCLLILYFVWVLELLARFTALRPLEVRDSLPGLAYLGAVTLSAVLAGAPSLARYELVLLVQAFLVYFYVAHAARTREDFLFIVRVVLVGVVLQGLIMIGLWIRGAEFTIASVQGRIDVEDGFRVAGTLGSPINAAGYFGLLLAPALGVVAAQLPRSHRLLGAIAFGLGSLAVILTLSRGGWLSCSVAVVLLCMALWRRGVSQRVAVILPAVGLVVLSVFHGPILDRLFGDDRGSTYSRIPLMLIASEVIADQPVTGIGPNNFVTVMQDYATGTDTWLHPVHNKYLLVWAETGVVGLLTFLALLVSAVRRGWQAWVLADPATASIALGLSAALIGTMAHMSVDSFASRPQVQLLWLVFGLVSAARRIEPAR